MERRRTGQCRWKCTTGEHCSPLQIVSISLCKRGGQLVSCPYISLPLVRAGGLRSKTGGIVITLIPSAFALRQNHLPFESLRLCLRQIHLPLDKGGIASGHGDPPLQ